MNITIKPLTPELSADYFDFFELYERVGFVKIAEQDSF
jgi:hypothetical protein